MLPRTRWLYRGRRSQLPYLSCRYRGRADRWKQTDMLVEPADVVWEEVSGLAHEGETGAAPRDSLCRIVCASHEMRATKQVEAKRFIGKMVSGSPIALKVR